MTIKPLPSGANNEARERTWRALASAHAANGERHYMVIGATRQGKSRQTADLMHRGHASAPSSIDAMPGAPDASSGHAEGAAE